MKHPSRSSYPAKSPTDAGSARSPVQPDPATHAPIMRWFGHLLDTRPMAFWSGIWVSTFLIGVVAFGSLLSPSASERRSVSAIALGSDSGVATQPVENQGKVPLWMFGAIALTCTAGSILVSRQLKAGADQPPVQPPRRPKQKRRPAALPVKAVTPRPAQKTKPRKKAVSRQPQRLKPYSPDDPLRHVMGHQPVPPVPAAIAVQPAPVRPRGNPSFVVAKQGSKTQPPMQAAQPVQVTVVPAEQPHPLDWTEPRLADDLDLRKQKPIQSWL